MGSPNLDSSGADLVSICIHRDLMLSGLLLGVLLGLEFLEFTPDVLGIQGLTIEQFKLT